MVDLNYVVVSKTSEIVQVMLEKMGIITRMSRILDKRNIPVAYAERGRTMENTGGNHQGSDLGLFCCFFFNDLKIKICQSNFQLILKQEPVSIS